MLDLPKPDPSIADQKKDFLERLKNQRLVLQGQEKIVFVGELLDIYDDFFILTDVIITGPQHETRPEWVLVDRKTISHIHPVAKVEKRTSDSILHVMGNSTEK
ncbi:MAG: hypothetical protein H8E38_07600 [SAR324 cluster bacterium]|nr:hypothetical protein [SAR324 cluster bacterium]MBL7034525.1 hypothetical protein [SAR324 cluster bacterium]